MSFQIPIYYTKYEQENPLKIAVIPAYRVISKFAKQAGGLPLNESIDSIESNLRDYMRNLLSMLHPFFAEIGERSAVAQLGDPVPDALVKALEELEGGNPVQVAEQALAIASERLPHPDLNSRVFLLPGDSESSVLVGQMKGAFGLSLGAQAMLVFLWPVEGWQNWLTYTVTHEYAHMVRNLFFPRGLAGGKLVYMNTQEPETLLDAILAEGLADVFATGIVPDGSPIWTKALDTEVEKQLWPRVTRRLAVSDPNEIRRVLFGDNDRIPQWTGYTIGYRIVKRYLEKHPKATLASLISIPARDIFEASEYTP